jgi:hypothetical protein
MDYCLYLGSSREGLKVGQADEFDVLMLFHIKDLPLEVCILFIIGNVRNDRLLALRMIIIMPKHSPNIC